MRKLLSVLLIAGAVLSGCSNKTKNAKTKFIETGISKYKIDKTIDTIVNSLKDKNYKIVNSFDHEKEALKLKQMLYPTKTIELYNPKIATKLIQCNPSISLELPIRVSIYNELNGKTHIAFTDPEYWSLKHNVKDSKCLQLIILTKQDLEEAASKVLESK